MISEWIAITGGCGYVGSHIALALKSQTPFKTLVIDNRADRLSHTHPFADEVVHDDIIGASSLAALDRLKPIAVIHCAASSLVTPSMSDPGSYYDNNVMKLKVLLDHMTNWQNKNIVFSSSSSVYGEGDGRTSNTEFERLEPISPYGKTKMIGEMLLQDYAIAHGINSIAFRYFNAVGANSSGQIGQEPGASHLIAKIMESILEDRELPVFGTDYNTRDGTCIRDYVHVDDIANAHVDGISFLMKNSGHHVYNIGSGCGSTVHEVIDAVEEVTGKTIRRIYAPRRPGDSGFRVADTTRVTHDLGWTPKYDLRRIAGDAYGWYTGDVFGEMIRQRTGS